VTPENIAYRDKNCKKIFRSDNRSEGTIRDSNNGMFNKYCL